MRSSLAKNAIYKVTLNLFNLLVPLLIGPYIAGLLDPGLYGTYNRVNAEFQVFLILGTFGIYNFGIREVSRVRDTPQKVNQLFTNLFVVSIAVNLVVSIAYVVYAFIRSTGIDLVIYLIMTIQLISNIFYIEFVNEAIENYKFITLKTIFIRTLYLFSIFAFVREKSDIIPYTIVVCLTILFNNLFSYIHLRKNLKFDFRGLQNIPRLIAPMIVTLLLTNVEMLYAQLDKVLLGPVSGDISVTEYTLPVTLVGMICTLPLSLVSVSIPRLSKLVGDQDRKGYISTFRKTCNSFMAMIIPMSFGIGVLSKEIMELYSHNVYTYVYPVLIITCICRIFYAYQSLISNLVMYINGMEKQLTFFMFIFGVSNLIMDGILIYFNVFSAATALATTGIATLLFDISATLFSRRVLNMNFGFFSKKILAYFVVSLLFIPVSALVHLLKLHFLINIIIIVPICIFIYGGYLLYSKDELIQLIFSRIRLKKD